MFTDMTLSEDLNSQFKTKMETKSVKLGFEFQMQVLTAGSWPLTTQAIQEFSIPIEVNIGSFLFIFLR